MLQTKCGMRQSWATCLNLDYDLLVFAWNGLNFDYDLLEGLNLDYDEMAWACTWKACILWVLAFDVDHAYTPLMGSSGELKMIQETIFGLHKK